MTRLGAVSVHAANGLWGLLAVGIFADGSYGGVSGLITGSGQQFLAGLLPFLPSLYGQVDLALPYSSD